MTGYRDNLDHVEDELRLLDLMIRARLAELTLQNELLPQSQTARTVYITRDEVDFLLTADGDAGADGEAADREAVETCAAGIAKRVDESDVRLPLPELADLFGLTPFETGALVVCLAPELRRKYDRIYAYLQDDITRRRPSVDLVLDLLCRTERDRWTARARFADGAPLLRSGLLRTVDDPQSPSGSSGLAQFLAIDDRICRFLLGADELDARLAGRVTLHRRPETGVAVDPVLADELHRLADHHRGRDTLVCHLAGPGAGDLARHVCHRLGLPVLRLDLTVASADHVRPAFREAVLHHAAVEIAGAITDDAAMFAAVRAAVADHGSLVFLTGDTPWTGPADGFAGARFHPVTVPPPDLARRAASWRHALAAHVTEPDGWALDLAARYRLPDDRIRAAVAYATDHRTRTGEQALTLTGLAAACRQLSDHALAALAVKVTPRAGWDDLVLPADRIDQLHDVAAQVRHRDRVFDTWGFGAKLSHGTGLSVLFDGPPGTGKTMAAEVLAGDLGLDLYKVDLSGVVSKYVGETEKNLARVFDEAQACDLVLFFDEADALFGKRTEVSDAHDRYANIETSYLLQRVEEYDGLVILATNLRQNMDEAFNRRIRFVVEFPFPEAASRTRIWRSLVPPDAPVASDVDFSYLGRTFQVTGGNIKNIVLNAAFLAAADGGVIDRGHILRGTRREFEKIGKFWQETG
jgi:hypothetical protein